MRRLGYAAVDALVERSRGLAEGLPWRGGSRKELEPILREDCPEFPVDADAVLDRALSDILPRAGRIDHPRFFAFVPSSPTWASVVGGLLANGFNIFQGTWLESAGPSQIELVVLEWFREWLGMPEGAGGLFTSGGSAANLGAVVAARDAAGHPQRPVVYLSDQSHSSVERACRIAGFRASAFRRIASDGDYRMDVSALAQAMSEDRKAGFTPVLVAANGGATNTGAVDPLPELADVCDAQGVWLHVDAAYGGFAVLTPRGRDELRGIERARSVTLDPHKWLFQPYETGCLLVRDPHDLERAFRVLPEYLQDTDLGMEQVNFADRGLQLTRAFRALKVWMSLQVHGRRAHAEAIGRGIALGDVAEELLRSHAEVEILSPSSLGIVCFRVRPSGARWTEDALEALNRGIQDAIVGEGTAMMSSTRLRGRYSLRLCILNFRSTQADVSAVVERIVALGRERAAAHRFE
jgi:glutamate/tyrosine decarboxylase-like PLP-dependent enzyme